MLDRLQPLRIPAGWEVGWNTLFGPETMFENGEAPGGSSLFSATNEHRRFWIDVEWRPEFDPEGEFRLRVEYAPWERTERGRRIPGPLHFRDAEVVHRFGTKSHPELVAELERWLARCTTWTKEGH